jgi:uncharacterized RDD family membrane protein YckC
MKYTIALPEQIDLDLDLASVGSRSLAMLVDLVIGGFILFIPYALLFLTARDATQSWLGQFGVSTVTLIFILLLFGFQWGYFNLFEWLWNGQTPGKRVLGLRVIRFNGAPVSWTDIFLRNLARPLDVFLTMGLVGLTMIFLSKRAQRLGDVMAQTIVIRETALDWAFIEHINSMEASGQVENPIVLSQAQWELLQAFILRQGGLPDDCRKRIAASIRQALLPNTAGSDLETSTQPDIPWLWMLAQRSQSLSEKA